MNTRTAHRDVSLAFFAHLLASAAVALATLAAGFAAQAIAAEPPGVMERAGQWMRGGEGARLTVVLLDTTSSVAADDRAVYERAFQSLLAAARPGDRIVLAAVADRPASRFVPVADVRWPSAGNAMLNEARARKARAELGATFGTVLAPPATAAKGTYLIDAVAASAEYLAQARKAGQAGHLVVLSDMIEESPVANFAIAAVDAAQAGRIAAAQRRAATFPDLKGVRVHVVGASGRDARQMAGIRAFWRAYLADAGAEVLDYGRVAAAVAGR
ncbi:MAG: hypothetical protein JNN03_18945 [Rubrivivax sp.]|nr:hypothetical protein [Rubrivivax sp.]